MDDAKRIHHWLIEQKKSLALAESCTGGQLAARFTAMADASFYFLGGVIPYSPLLKEKLLHVSPTTLRVHGAVSRETADEMWLGLMKLTPADYGIATTGIAGPTSHEKGKAVGTVFIALGERGKKPHVVECHFSGDRHAIIHAACDQAIRELCHFVGIG